MADKLGHRRGAGARHDQMRRRHALRQIGKERRAFGCNAEPRIDLAHGVEVFRARLLHDAQPRAHIGAEALDRLRHDLRHHMRALAAAEHEQPQRAARLRRGIGRGRRRDHGGPHRIAGEGDFGLQRGIEILQRRKAGGDLRSRARPACGWRGPSRRSARAARSARRAWTPRSAAARSDSRRSRRPRRA